MSVSGWMEKENVVYAYYGILFGLEKKKESLPFATKWMNLEMKEARYKKTSSAWSHLHGESKITRLIEAESGEAVRVWKGEGETGR